MARVCIHVGLIFALLGSPVVCCCTAPASAANAPLSEQCCCCRDHVPPDPMPQPKSSCACKQKQPYVSSGASQTGASHQTLDSLASPVVAPVPSLPIALEAATLLGYFAESHRWFLNSQALLRALQTLRL